MESMEFFIDIIPPATL